MSSITVVRSEADELRGMRGWALIYGRRKVGKTFLLRNFIKWDAFVTVKRDLSLRCEGLGETDTKGLAEEVGKVLRRGGTAVIDEFQRLPMSALEDLTTHHPQGRLILSGSSLGVVRRILNPKSPLLGFFTPFKVSLINPIDILSSLKGRFGPQDAVELSCYLRDPWLIPSAEGDALTLVHTYACKHWEIVKALVGEAFAEEERTLTKVYESILLLLGSFRWRANEIASILYSRGLIKEPSTSHIAGYMRNLTDMDLVTTLKIFDSRRKIHRIKSPIMEAFYYLESKYEVSERDVSISEVRPAIEFLVRKHVEDFVADLLAHYYGGRRECMMKPEVDVIVTRRGKPVLVGEVKWGEHDPRDLEKFREKVKDLPGVRVFVTKKKEFEMYKDVRILDAEDIAYLQLPII